MERVKKWILDNEPVVVMMLTVAVLRIPSLLEPLWYGDEGIYMLMGQALRHGLVWYKEIHDNKPPLLYLLAALSGSLMWLRLILMGWNLVNVVVVWELCKRVLKNRKWQIAMSWLFALLTTLPLIEGNIANGEIFMIMPVVAAMLWLLKEQKESKSFGYFGVGFLLAVGFLFKVPAAFDAVAAGLWLVWIGLEKKRVEWRKLLWLILGFGIPVGISIVYYFVKGAGWEYINAAFLQNVGYLSSWGGGAKKALWENGLLMRGVAAAIMSGVVMVSLRKKPETQLVGLWLIWAVFGAFLSGRPYPHYLLQVVAPLVLGMGMLIETKSKAVSLIMIVMIGALTLGIVEFKFYAYPVVSYYQKFLGVVSGKQNLEEYQNNFEGRVKRNYEVGRYIRMATTADEKIFVWGDEPTIYVVSERTPLGKYSVAYHIIDFRAVEQTMTLLKTEKPKVIVTFSSERRVLPGLIDLIESDYVLTGQIEEAMIYRKLAKK